VAIVGADIGVSLFVLVLVSILVLPMARLKFGGIAVPMPDRGEV
jgi:hypothetical protein